MNKASTSSEIVTTVATYSNYNHDELLAEWHSKSLSYAMKHRTDERKVAKVSEARAFLRQKEGRVTTRKSTRQSAKAAHVNWRARTNMRTRTVWRIRGDDLTT